MPTAMQPRPRKKALRVLTKIWKAWTVFSLALTALTAAALLALDLPAVRAQGMTRVSALLNGMFAGKVTIENLDHWGLDGVRGLRVRVVDPEGVPVLLADGVEVRLSVLAIAESALLGKGDLAVELDDLRLAHADINVDADGTGALRLLRAFEPREPKQEETAPSRGTRIHLAHVTLGHAWVHGQPPGAPLVDADLDAAEGSVLIAPQATQADLAKAHLRTRAMPQNANPDLDLEAHYAAPSRGGRDRGVEASLAGNVGGVPLSARGALEGDEVDAALDIPEVAAEAIRALLPTAPVYQRVAATARAHGRLPNVVTTAHVAIGAGAVDATIDAALAEETKIGAKIAAEHLDLRAFSPDGEATDLGADVVASASRGPRGDVAGEYDIQLRPGKFGPHETPPGKVAGRFRMAGETTGGGAPAATEALAVDGKGGIDDRGARVDLAFELRQARGAPPAIDLDLTATASDLAKTRLGPAVQGEARLAARGKVRLEDRPVIDATVDLQASHVAQGDLRVAAMRLHASAKGAADSPVLDAHWEGTDLAIAGTAIHRASATARGTTRAAAVAAAVEPVEGPRVDAEASVTFGAGIAVRDAYVAFTREDARAVVRAAKVSAAGDDVRAEGVIVEGLGDPLRLDAHKTSRELTVRASSNEIDLPKLARLLGLGRVESGHLALDVDLALEPTAARGTARLSLSHAAWDRIRNGSADLDATLEGRRAAVKMSARLGDLATLDLRAPDLTLDGSGPLASSSLQNLRGDVALDGQVEIARLRALFPRGSLPFSDLAGKLRIRGEITRPTREEPPRIRVAASTSGLVLAGRAGREQIDGTRVIGTPPWRLDGVDWNVEMQVHGATGAAEIAARAFDRHGAIVGFEARTPAAPGPWSRGGARAGDWQTIPVVADLVLPRRALESLPSALGTRGWKGDAGARLHVEGTLRDPRIELAAEAHGVKAAQLGDLLPIDATLSMRHRDARTQVALGVQSGGQELLDGEVAVKGALVDLIERPDDAAWGASTRVRLRGFPLESVANLGELRIKGRASGELSVEGLHDDARAKARIALDDLVLGRVRYPRGTVEVDVGDRALRAALHLQQQDGRLDADARIGVAWGRAIAPRVETADAATVSLRAEHARLGALQPFLADLLSEIDGRLDGQVRLDVPAGGKAPALAGKLVWSEGRFQLARMGEPFHDARATIALSPDGLIRVDDMVASGSTGKLLANASVRLRGLQWVGARGALRIPQREPIPLDVDGTDVGDVDGDILLTADASPDGRTTNIKVDIPRFRADLPEASSQKVQELGEADEIQVGYFRRPNVFFRLPLNAEDLEPPGEAAEPATTNVAIHLGEVQVRRGKTLRVVLDGNPTLQVTDRARMSGQIRLKEGLLEVQSRRFEIEKGTVTFVGDDPGNPQVVVTAGWTAPDGTRVYADFVGPLKTGKVTLRAEPARPQNEILALIMFGSASGSSTTPYPTREPNGATRAGTMVGGLATEGLSQGLDELTGLEVQAKIDTSQSANPRPELEIQIARDISLQIGYVIGTPPPGTNPDKTLVTLGWRFRRNWSMEATFGDQGSSIMDMIWQYRY